MKRIVRTTLFALGIIAGITLNGSISVVIAQDGLGSLEDLLAPSTGSNTRRSFNGRVQLYNNVLIYPMPVWSKLEDGAAPAERSQFQRSRKKGLFRLDATPHGENFKKWNDLFSIIAFENQPGPIEQQINNLARHYKTVCSPNNLKIFPAGKIPTKRVVVIFCGNYSRQREFGVVAAVSLFKSGNTGVTMMRQWKRKSFITSIRSNWPISQKEIDGVLGEMLNSKLLPTTN